jgi:RNA polymerase sigma factor (TIGR02999 family)
MDETVSALLARAQTGDVAAAQTLFATLYDELHRMARRELVRRGGRLTLGATTLLHEAWLDMSAREGPAFPDRPRFLGYASRVMRGLIIDYARRRRALKRGGAFEITALDIEVAADAPDPADLTAIGEALDRLAAAEPRLAQVVDLRFFCGFTFAETGAILGITERTAQRDWEKARIYLHRALDGDVGEA